MSFCGPRAFWEGGFTLGVSHWPSFASAGSFSPANSLDFSGGLGHLIENVFSREAFGDVGRLGDNGVRKPARFFDVFTPSHLVFIVGRQTALNVMLELSPYVSQVHDEIEEAEKENRDAVMPPFPPLDDCLRKGLFSAAKQVTVTLVRWLSDNLVYICLPVKIATELLKDARKEIMGLFEKGSSTLELSRGIYSTMLTTYCTWALAEFTVSMGLDIYAMGKGKRNFKAILSKAKLHAYRCGFLLFTDPIGGVVGGISSASAFGNGRAWLGVMIGFNVLDLFVASIVI
ncbi:hypothetical protein BSKO_02361 [Bryopsis sp. KO-2023]|nr:hypothetical protein BSKO_02361 [Bryopsis sp. KO-2023]